MKPKMIILEPEDLVEFALLGLLLGTHHPCLLPYLDLLEWDVCPMCHHCISESTQLVRFHRFTSGEAASGSLSWRPTISDTDGIQMRFGL